MARVEFELWLKNMTGSGFGKAKATARSFFDETEKGAKRVRKSVEDIGKTPGKVKIDTSDVDRASRKVDELHSKVRRGGDGGGGGGISMGRLAQGSFYGNLAERGVEMGLRKGKELLSEGYGIGKDVEMMKVGLGTFIGDAKSGFVVDRVMRESARTPYTTKQLLPIEQGLIAQGKDIDRAHRDTWALANVIAGVGGGSFDLERMGVLHLPQIAAAGYVEGMQRREMMIGKVPFDKIIADYLKVPMSQVADMVSEKKITYDVLTNALVKAGQKGNMFAGAMDRLSQTMGGKESTIKDLWEMGWAKTMLNPAAHDNIIKVQDRMIAGMQDLPEIMGKMSGSVNRVFEEFNDLWPSMKRFGRSFGDFLKPVGGFLLSNEVKDLARSMLDLSTTILTDLKPALVIVAGLAKKGAGFTGLTLGSMANDLDFKGAADRTNKFYDEMPKWAGKVGFGGSHKLHEYMMQNFGGKVEDWMNDKKQLAAFKKTGAFDMAGLHDRTAMARPEYAGSFKARAMADQKKITGGGSAPLAMTGSESDAITSGGGRAITMNLHFMEKATNTFHNVKEGAKEISEDFRQALLRSMYGIPGLE
jgi:hypothetical protein